MKALLVQMVDVERRTPGIVVGMISANPEERWVVGYGRLSRTDTRVPDGDTVFEIGSITKVFTGTLLAQAVLNSEVHLDDPISKYLPEGVTAPAYEGRSITLLDLATHTSGLPKMPSSFHPKDMSNPYVDYTIDQMYDFLSGYRLNRAPGSVYEYSNYGMGLLGNLLVRRAGLADYEALLIDRITGPLGMDSTSIELTQDMESRLATPHSSYSVATSLWDNFTLAGAGGIRSTANDLLTFLAANMGITDTELRPALQLASTAQRSIGGPDTIGLGWHLFAESLKIGDRRFLIPPQGIPEHRGATGGSRSFLSWDPQRKIGVVVLANCAVSIEDIGYQLMGTTDLALSNLLFLLTAIVFMLLLAVLLAAQKNRWVKTTWVVGILWLLLAAPLAFVFSRFLTEWRGTWTFLLPLSLVLLFMLAKGLLDFVFRIDFKQNRLAHLAYLMLGCLALFGLIWIGFSIHPSWGIPVLISFGILVVSLIVMYRDKIRVRK